MKRLENYYQVKVKLQLDLGQLFIQGLHQDVHDASDIVQRILRDVDCFRLECEKAAILSNHVQWYFVDTDEQGQESLTKYDKDVTGTVEKAYYDQFPTVTLQAGGRKYIFDFSAMKEFPTDNPLDIVTIVRKDLTGGMLLQNMVHIFLAV